MEINDVQKNLELAKQAIPPDALGGDIEVAFEVRDEAGRLRHVYFNLCTVYTESRVVVFSLEGPVTQIFRTPIVPEGEHHDI